MPSRKLRMGMIGGGEGSFMGGVHRIAARLDGLIDCVAGALSSDPAKALRSGESLGLAPDRNYRSYEEMIDCERARPDRIDFVSIVTPNHRHFAPAKMALEAGFDVVIDKPLCFNWEEARELRRLVRSQGRVLALTHTYSAYPAVVEARERVRAGALGRLKKVVVTYPQGWLSEKIEDQHQKQAEWRTDPAQAGPSGCFGDIGTHALNLAESISGQRVTSVLAELSTYVPGRRLDDDATVLMRFDGGLRGCALVSQISTGEGNGISLSLYGETAALHWSQVRQNELKILYPSRPTELLEVGAEKSYLSPAARAHTRLPSGHPEGYLEAFANIYRNLAHTLLARESGTACGPEYSFPNVETGCHGMALIEAVVASSRAGSIWTAVKDEA